MIHRSTGERTVLDALWKITRKHEKVTRFTKIDVLNLESDKVCGGLYIQFLLQKLDEIPILWYIVDER